MMDLISVIIPAYNTPIKFLKQCLESVFCQTYKNLEILIVDDGSRKEFESEYSKIIRKDSRVKVIKKNNTGVSDSRNVGIKRAKGKYIMFVDSDDYIDNDYIEILYNNLISKNVNIVITGATIVNENFKTLEKQLYKCDNKRMKLDEYIDDFINYPYFTCVKMLIKREIIDQYFKAEIKYGEDMLFSFNLLRKNEMVYLQNCGYYYVQNSKSATYSFDIKSMDKYIRDNVKVFNEILKYFPEKVTIINNRLFSKLNIAAVRVIRSKGTKYEEVKEFIKNSLNYMNNEEFDISDINYVSRLSKFELLLIAKKKYFIYYIFIKTIYRIKR